MNIIEFAAESLTGIPSIIFGLFGQMVICPIVNNLSNLFNYQTMGGASLLSGIIVLAIMSIPTITGGSITSVEAGDKKYIEVEESEIDVRLTNEVKEDGTTGAPSLYANIPILNVRNDMKKEVEEKADKEEKNEDKQEKTDPKDKEENEEIKENTENNPQEVQETNEKEQKENNEKEEKTENEKDKVEET